MTGADLVPMPPILFRAMTGGVTYIFALCGGGHVGGL